MSAGWEIQPKLITSHLVTESMRLFALTLRLLSSPLSLGYKTLAQ